MTDKNSLERNLDSLFDIEMVDIYEGLQELYNMAELKCDPRYNLAVSKQAELCRKCLNEMSHYVSQRSLLNMKTFMDASNIMYYENHIKGKEE